jgi:hypothetical protein
MQEIKALVEILGLRFGTEYKDTKSLRYGHVMVMADQDHDGSHIKGLVINFLHAYVQACAQEWGKGSREGERGRREGGRGQGGIPVPVLMMTA